MADTEISNLTEDAAPGLDSLLVTVDDPAGTPATRKSTIQSVMDLFEANMTVPTSVSAAYQPLDSDLTAIAALTTTTYGRGLLALADAAALRASINVEDGATADQTAAEIAAMSQDWRGQGAETLIQATAALQAGSGGSALEVEDEGVSLSTAVTKINFVGSGVTATEPVADEITVTIAGGAAPVDSVNGQTGVVVLDPDDLDDTSTTNKFTSAAEISKLAGIEAGATADQTGAEIKAAYEAEANTNALTDALLTKLNGIETAATADQSDAEIETAYNNQVSVVSQAEAEAGTATTVRRWTAQRVAQAIAALGGGAGNVTSGSGAPASTPSAVGDVYIDTTGDVAYIATGTASSADWDEILTAASGSTLTAATSASGDSVPFFDASDSDNPKQTTIANLIADNSIQVEPSEGGFANGDKTKLDGIEAGADVTDAANVETAIEAITLTAVSGATGDEVLIVDATDGGLKAVLWENLPGAGGGLANVVEDTTPQLGGDLDGQGNRIAGYLGNTPGTVSGALTAATHGGGVHETSGNVTIPTTAGFQCVLIAGGAHTVTFNSTTSAAMAAGDLMTIVVEDATTIHAVLTAAADKVSFT